MILSQWEYQVLSEAQKVVPFEVTDKEQIKVLNEYAAIKEQIQIMKAKMKPYEAKASEMGLTVAEIFETLDKTQLKTDKAVIKRKKAHITPKTSYKTLWNAALKKVNANTRKVLEALKEEFTNLTDVADSFSVTISEDVLVLDEGFLDKIKTAVKKIAAKFKSIFKDAKKAEKSADDLLKMS